MHSTRLGPISVLVISLDLKTGFVIDTLFVFSHATNVVSSCDNVCYNVSNRSQQVGRVEHSPVEGSFHVHKSTFPQRCGCLQP